MAKEYNFQYTPLTGRLPGNSFVKQTEQAINELAGIVNEGSAQVEVITNLANTANANSEEALGKANEALETAGRVYITLPNLDDADSYFDSQLYYFANSYSHNLPVQDTGFLEVKTNDTKTACEQEFVADLTGLSYFRHGTITSTEVGSETVYSVTWGTWSGELASEDYVQQEIVTAINAANGYTDEKVANYLPLSGGTMSGAITLSDGGNPLSTAGGTMSGAIEGNPLTLTADDGNGNSADLVLNADGSLTWNGKQFVANETVDISSVVSATVTSGNATVVDSYPRAYRFGKVVHLVFAIKTTSTVSVGSSITGSFSGIPDLINDSYGVGYSGSSCGVFLLSLAEKRYNIRITGADLPSNYTYECSAIYLMP